MVLDVLSTNRLTTRSDKEKRCKTSEISMEVLRIFVQELSKAQGNGQENAMSPSGFILYSHTFKFCSWVCPEVPQCSWTSQHLSTLCRSPTGLPISLEGLNPKAFPSPHVRAGTTQRAAGGNGQSPRQPSGVHAGQSPGLIAPLKARIGFWMLSLAWKQNCLRFCLLSSVCEDFWGLEEHRQVVPGCASGRHGVPLQPRWQSWDVAQVREVHPECCPSPDAHQPPCPAYLQHAEKRSLFGGVQETISCKRVVLCGTGNGTKGSRLGHSVKADSEAGLATAAAASGQSLQCARFLSPGKYGTGWLSAVLNQVPAGSTWSWSRASTLRDLCGTERENRRTKNKHGAPLWESLALLPECAWRWTRPPQQAAGRPQVPWAGACT